MNRNINNILYYIHFKLKTLHIYVLIALHYEVFAYGQLADDLRGMTDVSLLSYFSLFETHYLTLFLQTFQI
jgi:hypothetical protein